LKEMARVRKKLENMMFKEVPVELLAFKFKLKDDPRGDGMYV